MSCGYNRPCPVSDPNSANARVDLNPTCLCPLSASDSFAPTARPLFRLISERARNGGLLRRGNFTSKKELRTKIEAFITYFNRTMAKPFRWTMEAKPLTC